MSDKPLLFSTQKYQYLADAMLQTGYFDAGSYTHKTFPDQEIYHCLLSNVENKEVVLLGGTIDDSQTMEIFDLACALVAYGARKLNIFIPYYGYSTMERAVRFGEIVKAKTRARLFSAIPKAYYGNKIFLLDLHAEGITHYFEGGIRPVHIYAKPLIIRAAHQLAGQDFVLASTDAGRAKWVESLAFDLHVEAAFVYKRRSSGSDTQVTGVNADVQQKKVVIYDDMIRTGGSLINAAKAYLSAGAKEVSVISTHGIFCNHALERIESSGVIKKIAVSNSHPNAVELASKSSFLQIFCLAELITENMRSQIHII